MCASLNGVQPLLLNPREGSQPLSPTGLPRSPQLAKPQHVGHSPPRIVTASERDSWSVLTSIQLDFFF